ncbi:hypothetical protein [Rickettsiales endosymbiont of Stachyamoeba lipophora]|uniref:hypothetical protein n=1 Tax=Rickettsiales endosymbiont of Stachyamoeba lipophora TaxID=2486578 RepID=UPI000F64E888|nr:hypothetical protein [Rickettsiales endosymbiont of Stachyamoeba lipophora]AZL16116.1 hypothetical protein EF513_06175 [Rickettsiales endosymbiont of Stachyamoeba lipophora]
MEYNLTSITGRLNYLRTLTRLSRNEIFKKYNIPEITLRLWENGKIPITAKGIKRCLALYAQEGLIVTEEWLKYGKGSKPLFDANLWQAPLLSQNDFNSDTSRNINDLSQDAAFLKELHPSLMIFNIIDENMSPIYNVGDFVAGFITETKLQELNNTDCLVWLGNGNLVFRRVIITSDKTSNLTIINPFVKINEPIIYNADIKQIIPIKFHRKK